MFIIDELCYRFYIYSSFGVEVEDADINELITYLKINRSDTVRIDDDCIKCFADKISFIGLPNFYRNPKNYQMKLLLSTKSIYLLTKIKPSFTKGEDKAIDVVINGIKLGTYSIEKLSITSNNDHYCLQLEPIKNQTVISNNTAIHIALGHFISDYKYSRLDGHRCKDSRLSLDGKYWYVTVEAGHINCYQDECSSEEYIYDVKFIYKIDSANGSIIEIKEDCE